MADFFEEFGRMVSDVASDITKKTGDTLEIQKIKSNVRSLKRANERDLADIGRMGTVCLVNDGGKRSFPPLSDSHPPASRYLLWEHPDFPGQIPHLLRSFL